MLELKLLGVPELFYQGEKLDLPSPKNLAILAYLALRADARERSELMELFWQAGKASNVRFALFKLREIVGSQDWLETSDKFAHVKAITDVGRIEQAIQEKRFIDAFSIWHEGDEGEKIFLKGLELKDAPAFQSWLELERSRLDQLYLEALQEGIQELEQAKKHSEALELARILLEKDKLNETAHRAIMRLEFKQGNTVAALAQFETCRLVLQEELGVEPLDDTLVLLKEIEQPSVSHAVNAFLIEQATRISAQTDKLFGREALLEEALAQLETQAVLLHGFGGSGKTALAASVAAEHLKKQTASKVLWLQAGDDAPELLFDAVARALNAQKQVAQADTSSKANVIRTLLAANKISLFVLDDVWNAYALSKLKEAIPQGTALLVTSRQRYSKLKRLDVGRLTRQAALELLSHHAMQNLSADESAHKLCESLGDHAFALRIAGITLQVDNETASHLLEQIISAPHTMKTPNDFAEEGRESVTALLNASLSALSEEAHEAFMAFGVLFSSSATAELLALCARRGENETEEALFELQKRGLAERVTKAGSDVISYRLHDLAFSFAKANKHFRIGSAQRACQSYLEKHKNHVEVVDAEIANLLGATESAEDAYLLEMVKGLTVGDAYYLARGHSPRSLRLLKRAIRASKEAADLESAHYLLARLGDAYRTLYGNHKAALKAFQEALVLAQELKNTPREIVMLTLIGTTKSQQDMQAGEDYLHKAQALAKAQQDDKALCQVLEHLGCLAGGQADFETSLAYFQEALEAIERLALTSIPKNELTRLRFFTLLNLGETERGLNAFEKALGKFNQAKQLAQKHHNQLWLAYSFQGLAETYQAMQKDNLAQDAYQQAFWLYKQNRASNDLTNIRNAMQAANYDLSEQEVDLALAF